MFKSLLPITLYKGNLFAVIGIIRAHPDQYENFDTEVAFLIHYINKKALTPSMKVASIGQNRPAKWQRTSATHGTFKGEIDLKMYSTEEYDSMFMVQCWQLHDLKIKALKKTKKPAEH